MLREAADLAKVAVKVWVVLPKSNIKSVWVSKSWTKILVVTPKFNFPSFETRSQELGRIV